MVSASVTVVAGVSVPFEIAVVTVSRDPYAEGSSSPLVYTERLVVDRLSTDTVAVSLDPPGLAVAVRVYSPGGSGPLRSVVVTDATVADSGTLTRPSVSDGSPSAYVLIVTGVGSERGVDSVIVATSDETACEDRVSVVVFVWLLLETLRGRASPTRYENGLTEIDGGLDLLTLSGIVVVAPDVKSFVVML